MHFSKKHRLARDYAFIVASATKNKHAGKVSLLLTRYSSGPEMDYDNLVSTGKLIIDAIVLRGVISDDNQQVIVERRYTYEKVKRIQAKTVITITDYHAAI